MIARIALRGLGPHVDTQMTFEKPLGRNEVTGRSEAGKSTIIDGVTFALWGCDRTGKPLDIREINDDCDAVSVTLELASGATIERTLRKDKDGKRGKTTRAFKGQPYSTEKKWLGAIGLLGKNAPALRQVLVPFAWVPLLQGEGHGRPLRDMLASVLPKADKVQIVSNLLAAKGFEMQRGDPVHEGDAKELRARANRTRDKQAGDVERLRQLVDAGEAEKVDAVDEDALEIARGVIWADELWKAYDHADDAFTEREELIARQTEQAEAWDARFAELGERPEGTADAVMKANKATEQAQWKRQRVGENRDKAFLQAKALEERAAGLEDHWHPAQSFTDAINEAQVKLTEAKNAAKHADVCPHCKRGDWKDGASVAEAAVAEALAALEDARSRYAAEVTAREVARNEEIDRVAKALKDAKKALAEQDTAHKRAEEAVTQALAEAATVRSKESPGVDWDGKRKALGDRPKVSEPCSQPDKPSDGRPNAQELEQARRAVEDASKAAGRAEQRSQDLESLRKTLQTSEAALEAAEGERARLDALVDAVRRAPSEAARAQRSALGDLGPVSLTLRKDGGVDVLIDQRPWHLASTGRRVVADAWFRAALRRAIGLSWLPLFIDCTQDVVGQPLPKVAPVFELRTTEGHLSC